METRNKLFFSTTRTVGGEFYKIEIKLADDCKNGHEDFSIGADYWKANKNRTEQNQLGFFGGCSVTEIFPEFEIFGRLSNSDYLGQPTYAIQNGLYFLQNETKEKAMDYLRITETEFDILRKCTEEGHLAILLEDLGIRQRWALEANEAKKQLENLCGYQFVSAATRSNWVSDDKMNEFRELKKTGYYTPKAAKARSEAAKADKFEKARQALKAEREKAIHKAETGFNVKLAILDAGYLSTNFIYYDHSNQIAFNWLDYGTKFTPEQVSELMPILQTICPGLTLTQK